MDSDKKLLPLTSGWRRYSYVEPPIFLIFLSLAMTSTVFTDLMIYLTCQNLYPTNKTECDILHTNSTSEEAMNLVKIVQPYASYITLLKSLIEGIVPAALILFLGPWSDKFGRKPLLIAGFLAPTLNNILVALLYQFDVNALTYLIASIPGSLCGGTKGGFLAVLCFVSDITSNERRSTHIACIEGFAKAGMVIGTFIGPLILQQCGYLILFIIAAFITLSALVHIVFYIPETIQNKTNIKWGNPFDFRLVKQMFETPIKKRPGLNRYILWCCILFICLQGMVEDGSIAIAYLFANSRLGWNLMHFSIYRSLSMIFSATSVVLGLKIMKSIFGLSDVVVALIGCTLNCITFIIRAYTYKSWHFYLATGTDSISNIAWPSVQSILTMSVPADDIGKIFSLTSFMEASLPMVGASLYTLVYTNFMPPIYPSPVYLMSVGLLFVMMIPLICIYWNQTKCQLIPQTTTPEVK